MPKTTNSLDYEVKGSGSKSIVVLHGGLGLDRTYLNPLIGDLSEIAQVVAYDHRGNGQSEELPNTADLTMDALINDIDKVCDELNVERFVLYGHSYGGFIALEYATRQTTRLDGLILSNTAADLSHPPQIPDNTDPAAIAAIGALFSGPMQTDEQWAETWQAALPLYTPELSEEQRVKVVSEINYRAAAWNQGAALLSSYNVSGQLDKIDIPTLLLSGAQDFITGPAAHDAMHTAIPGAELKSFDAGHFPFISKSSEYRGAIESWLQRLG